MWNSEIILIKQTFGGFDENGFAIEATEERTPVFAKELSISMAEFYNSRQSKSAQHGVDAVQIKFEILQEEYDNQTIVEHDGRRFKVVRLFKKKDKLELTLSDLSERGVVNAVDGIQPKQNTLDEKLSKIKDTVVFGFEKKIDLSELKSELALLEGKLIIGDVVLDVEEGELQEDFVLNNVFCIGNIKILGAESKDKAHTRMVKSIIVQNVMANTVLVRGFSVSEAGSVCLLSQSTLGDIVFEKCACFAGSRQDENNIGVKAKASIVYVTDCQFRDQNKAITADNGGQVFLGDENNKGSNNYYAFSAGNGGQITVSENSILATYVTHAAPGGLVVDGSVSGVSLPSRIAGALLNNMGLVLAGYNLNCKRANTGLYDFTFNNKPRNVHYAIETSPSDESVVSNKTASGFRVERRKNGVLSDVQFSIFVTQFNTT